MSFKSDQLFADVNGNTVQTSETVVPVGETWEVQKFVGAGAYLSDVEVKLIWDYGGASPEILASTHGDANIVMARQLVGDGVKKLALALENDTAAQHTVGGLWEGLVIQ